MIGRFISSHILVKHLLGSAVLAAMLATGSVIAATAQAHDFNGGMAEQAQPELVIPAHLVGSLFNSDETEYSNRRGRLDQWDMLQAHLESERTAGPCAQAGDFCLPAKWQAKLVQWQSLPRTEQVDAVNDFLNKYTFIEDRKNYGRADYWATPAEFAAHGGGDCEDYAISKMAILTALGWPQGRHADPDCAKYRAEFQPCGAGRRD